MRTRPRRPATAARIVTLGALLLLALPFAGCGASGQECDTCSSDDDCNAGLVCASFSDGSRRCASGSGDTRCRVR